MGELLPTTTASDRVFGFGEHVPAAWAIDPASREAIGALLVDQHCIALGARWHPPAAESAGPDPAPPGHTAVLADRPLALPDLCSEAEARGATRVVTIDWPLPGRVVAAHHVSDHGHQLWVYDAGDAAIGASFDEQHQLVVCHPEYDGFVVTYVVAHADIADLHLVVDAALMPHMEAHHLDGPLLRGQVRPVDLELHPGRVPRPGVHGSIRVADGKDVLRGPAHRITLATTLRATCSVAGDEDGPFPAQELERIAAMLVAGKAGAAAVAAAIERAERRAATPPKTGMAGHLQGAGDRLRRRMWGIS